MTHDYIRHGTTDLFAALDVRAGTVIGRCRPRHRSAEFRAFLDTIEANVPTDLDVHLVLDNAAIHKTKLVSDWLVKRPRFHLHFTPTSSSWLNLVECWFAVLTRRRLQRGIFTSTRDLGDAIRACIAETNADPRPFVWTTSADEILARDPDGVFLSNGPGDPAAVTYAIDTLRALLGQVPLFGICLGSQLLGHALGADTYKLRFGHRGVNQPVLRRADGVVEITSHNHGFAVDASTLGEQVGEQRYLTADHGEVEVNHVNLNDLTCEGLVCLDLPAFSVQYHPEAGPGPHDATYLFDRFARLMAGARTAG